VLGQQSLQDDPFISAGTGTPSAAHGVSTLAQAPSQQSPETFELPLAASDSEGTPESLHPQARRPRNAPIDPYPPTPSRGSLRRQQRAEEREAISPEPESGPAGNKKGRHAATDVYTFFEDQEGKRVCKFCL
jgi:hypothetical protein